MTDKLPPNLLALFQPRPPLRYLAPCDHAPEQRRTPRVTGVAQYLEAFRNSEDNYVPTESVMQRRERLREEKKQAAEQKVKEALEKYHPAEDPQIRGDPYKTLFVSRLSYEVKESDLEREFGRFGPIERIRIVRSKDPNSKKPHRGYAFIVYEREKDMKAAYKETDGIRIKDRRVLVDVERGRTVKGWKPRRLGGGLGGRGYTKAPISRPSGPAGGFDRFGGPPRGGGFGGRGGFRGGPGGPGGPGGFGGGGRGGGGFGGRGGFDGPRGPRGGIGYQGGGGFGGDRGGNFQNGGQHEAPPPNAPTGPGGNRGGSGGYQGGGNSGGGRFGDRGGFGGDRDRSDRGFGGGDRGSGGGFGDRGDRNDRGSGGGFGGRDGGYSGGRQGGDRDGGDRNAGDGGRGDGGRGGYGRDGGDRDRGYGGSRYPDDQGRKRQHDGDSYGGGQDSRRRRY